MAAFILTIIWLKVLSLVARLVVGRGRRAQAPEAAGELAQDSSRDSRLAPAETELDDHDIDMLLDATAEDAVD